MMELDPQLQNISDADLQDFAVPHYPNFDQGYQSALYDNGLAHFIADSNASSQLSMTRSQNVNIHASNVNGQNLSVSSTSARQPRHISHQPPQHHPHFHNGYHPQPTAVPSPNQLRQTVGIHPSVTSPSRPSKSGNRSQPQHPQLQVQPQAQPRPPQTPQPQSSHSRSQSQLQAQQRDQDPLIDPSQFNHPSTFPLIPNPPDLAHWREKFFNIVEPLLLTSEEYHTYFPHVDNIYSHRSTQKYKKKPFVSHYWDCRLKGRPTGTPLSKLRKKQEGKDDEDDDAAAASNEANNHDHNGGADKEIKKRKRKTRERDLCDVKIKVTEFFGRDELEALGKLGIYDATDEEGTLNNSGRAAPSPIINREITFVHEDGISNNAASAAAAAAAAASATPNRTAASGRDPTSAADDTMPFGILEPLKKLPEGHPGADGKRWYMVQRVNGMTSGGPAGGNNHNNGRDDDDPSLDHKHTLEESDRIKKNSVQRWLLAREKEMKKLNKRSKNTTTTAAAATNTSAIEADADAVANVSVNGTASMTSTPKNTTNNNNKNKPRESLPLPSSLSSSPSPSSSSTASSIPSFHASGKAQQTARSHHSPASTRLTLYSNSFCPFAQRIWIALETKGIPYQYVEATPAHKNKKTGRYTIPGLLEVCPEGIIPCLRHGNWAIWESDVILEYLEDLSIGHSLLPLGDPQLRAHSRLWKDHINRKVLPYFYALLLFPATDNSSSFVTGSGGGGMIDGATTTTATTTEAVATTKPDLAERQSLLINTLQRSITELVNASHATGPFFLGADISLVDVAFAPWIIRLSRVLEYYREFPKPEVGTRWKAWVDAVENEDAVRRTVSDDKSYHAVYGGVGRDARTTDPASVLKGVSEIRYARMLVGQAGFGLGGDVWGELPPVVDNNNSSSSSHPGAGMMTTMRHQRQQQHPHQYQQQQHPHQQMRQQQQQQQQQHGSSSSR